MIDETDYRRLARYFAGEDAADERAATEAWLNESPARLTEAARLRALWRVSETASFTPDVDDAWTRFATRLHVGDAQSPLTLVGTNAARAPNPTPRRTSGGFTWRGASSRRTVVPVLVGVIAASAALFFLIAESERAPIIDRVQEMQSAPRVREFRTARGQRGVVAIGDDSRVELGAESVLRVSEVDAHGRRVVELEGEAVFDVVHDTLRPFEVRAGNAITEDLGTRFTVRAYHGEPRVQVFVASGSVALRAVGAPATSGTLLGPRDLGTLDTLGRTVVRNNVDSTSHLGWTRDRFVFSSAPLRDVLRDVSRWYDVQITTADTALLSRRITMNVPARSLSDVLGAITTPLRLRAERHGSRIVIQ